MIIVDPKFTKAVSSLIMVQTETTTSKSAYASSLKYSLSDRSNSSDKKGHYFSSFNMPVASTYLTTGSTMIHAYPELYQLNVDQIIIAEIPYSAYSEFIDGRSIRLRAPYLGSTILLYSSTYSSDKILKNESNPLLGDNIAFLFSDTINRPYTGFTVNDIGQRLSHSANTSWNPSTDFLDRPAAVSYIETKGNQLVNGLNTDTRTVNRQSVALATTYPDGVGGYNYDVPCGFAVLDKGYLVLTHTAITQNFGWSSGTTQAGLPYTGGTNDVSGKTQIYFTGTTSGDYVSEATYKDLNTAFQISAVCVAMPREFYMSNNPTWNRALALAELNEQTGIINLSPVYVTEVGLYNALGELIAVAKLSEPVEKSYANVITFTLNVVL